MADHWAYPGCPDGYYAEVCGNASGLMNAGSAVADIISPIALALLSIKQATGVYHSTVPSHACYWYIPDVLHASR